MVYELAGRMQFDRLARSGVTPLDVQVQLVCLVVCACARVASAVCVRATARRRSCSDCPIAAREFRLFIVVVRRGSGVRRAW